MWLYNDAGKVNEVLAGLQAIDPQTLEKSADRLVRNSLINLLIPLPVGMGIILLVQSTDDLVVISIQHKKFGVYAT